MTQCLIILNSFKVLMSQLNKNTLRLLVDFVYICDLKESKSNQITFILW